jgi:hypothetical protein
VIGLGVREARAYLAQPLPATINLRALEISANTHYRTLIEQGVRCKDAACVR